MFHDTVKEAQRSGKLGTCKCWDCLRAVGLTPPYMLRDKYPRKYPHTIFNERPESELCDHGDPNGIPMANRNHAD